jgi:hypothetical protein
MVNKKVIVFGNIKISRQLIIVIFAVLAFVAVTYYSFKIVSAGYCTNYTCINGYKFRDLPILGKTCTTC